MKLQGIAYITPVVRYDSDARVLVVQRRDADTGKVSQQFPSERAIRELRVAADVGAPKLIPVPAAPKAENVVVQGAPEPPVEREPEPEPRVSIEA